VRRAPILDAWTDAYSIKSVEIVYDPDMVLAPHTTHRPDPLAQLRHWLRTDDHDLGVVMIVTGLVLFVAALTLAY
jgi:hypothetical protein